MALEKESIIQIVLERFPEINSELVGRFKVVDVNEGRALYLIKRTDVWQQPIEPPFEEPAEEASDE